MTNSTRYRLLFAIAVSALLLVLFALKNRTSRTVNLVAEMKKHGTMGDDYFRSDEESCSGHCQWTQIGSNILRLDGSIDDATYTEFKQKLNASITTIELNSSGGSVDAALKIAAEIQSRKMTVIATGFCISSCANYLFLAGDKKVIRGLLGFHGSNRAARVKKQ